MKGSVATLFPPSIETDKDTIDKDGEDPGDIRLQNIDISIAINGYTVTYVYEDGSDQKYVHTDFDKVLQQLREKH